MTEDETNMKTVRIREKIKVFLAERPRNTAEILEHINSTMRHGTTSQQLGNVLSKDKDIVKVGYIKRSGILSGGYDICEWATVNWVQGNVPGWEQGDPILLDKTSPMNGPPGMIGRTNILARAGRKLQTPLPPPKPVKLDLNTLTCEQLKDRLRKVGLTVSGRKEDLVARLSGHDDPMFG
jgi:hypothetical protein